ncbi:MAG: MCE family protein, partial [Oricola sp.]|nr:MCE family protein [Oricola sp.]
KHRKVRRAVMQKYRGSSLVRAGFIGVVLIALVIMVGLQPQKLWAMATSVRYQAVFAEAGGLSAGNNVKVSGVTVGTVSDITLERGAAMVTFSVNSAVPIGSDTTASIGFMPPGATIMPTSAVKMTSDITRGFSSAK